MLHTYRESAASMVLSTAFNSCKPGENIADLSEEEVEKRMMGSLKISADSVKIAICRVDYSNQILKYFVAVSSSATTTATSSKIDTRKMKAPASIYQDFNNPAITDQKLAQFADKVYKIYNHEKIFQTNKECIMLVTNFTLI